MKFIKKIIKNLSFVFKRMPVSVLFSVLVFVLFLFKIYVDNLSGPDEIILNNLLATGIFTFFFSLAIYLFSENINFSYHKYIQKFSPIITLIFAVLFYCSLKINFIFSRFSEENIVYLFTVLISIFSFIILAPFLQKIFKKELFQEDFYQFTLKIFSVSLLSIFFGLTILALGFIALGAIFSLFEINFLKVSNFFFAWSVFSLTLFAPIYFLTKIPKNNKSDEDDLKQEIASQFSAAKSNKISFFLINYLGLSAITIYFLILYAYTIKVLLNFSAWPEGQISYLVIVFTFFGYLIYFALHQFKDNFKLAQLFQKLFPFLVIPQLGMLFYAIFLRIGQYDWTINRYLVVIFGLWLLFISLYFIFSKKKYLSTIPLSLVIFILLISFGSWSVYNFPEQQQKNNLIINLEKAEILQNGKIIPLQKSSDIDEKLSGEIYSAIQYLCRSHSCKSLENIFEIKKDSTTTPWDNIDAITEKIKVQQHYSRILIDENNENYIPNFYNFSVPHNQKSNLKNLRGFDYLIFLNHYKEIINLPDLNFNFKIQDYEKQISEQLLELVLDKNKFHQKVSIDDLIFDFETKTHKIKLHLSNFSVQNPNQKNTMKDRGNQNIPKIINTDFHFIETNKSFLLIKEKR